MHELPVAQGILKIAVEEGEKHKVNKISLIRIKVGMLSDLFPECINNYFELLSKGTIAEGAVIEVDKLPLKAKCNDCSEISEIEIKSFRCLKCSSQNLSIIQGNEFYIDSLEAE